MEERETISCTHCQHHFAGNFCPECGQSVKIYEKPVLSFIREFLGDVFAFDSRLWRSIPALLWKPGTLVSEYVGGRHAAYVPPFRMYVFVSFVFFLLLDMTATRELDMRKGTFQHQLTQDSVKEMQNSRISGDTSITVSAQSQNLNDTLVLQNLDIRIGGQDSTKTQLRLQEIISDPAKYVQKFNKNLSWSLFLLMPTLGFFFWLMLRKNRPFYVPHFLFAIQLHIVLFLVFILLMSSELIWPGLLSNTLSYLFWLLPIHAIAGAKKLFGLGWFSSFWRLSLATFLYLICVITSSVLMAFYIFTT